MTVQLLDSRRASWALCGAWAGAVSASIGAGVLAGRGGVLGRWINWAGAVQVVTVGGVCVAVLGAAAVQRGRGDPLRLVPGAGAVLLLRVVGLPRRSVGLPGLHVAVPLSMRGR